MDIWTLHAGRNPRLKHKKYKSACPRIIGILDDFPDDILRTVSFQNILKLLNNRLCIYRDTYREDIVVMRCHFSSSF